MIENQGWWFVRLPSDMFFLSCCWSYGAGGQRTGTVAFRGQCDVTLSLSLNPVPVRKDYTPEHTHTYTHTHTHTHTHTRTHLLPMELQSDRLLCLHSYTHSEERREGKCSRGVRGERRIYKEGCEVRRERGERGKRVTEEGKNMRREIQWEKGEWNRGRQRNGDWRKERATCLEGGLGWRQIDGRRNVGGRWNMLREAEGGKRRKNDLQTGRKRYKYLRKGTIREMACLQINWN